MKPVRCAMLSGGCWIHLLVWCAAIPADLAYAQQNADPPAEIPLGSLFDVLDADDLAPRAIQAGPPESEAAPVERQRPEIQNPFDDLPFDLNALGSDTEAMSEAAHASPRRNVGQRIEMLDDYDAAVEQSLLQQRPILAILGAEWCTWCRKLEGELSTSAASGILGRWIVVAIDVDESPELAQRMQAYALPSLRILGFDQEVVAKAEGYVPLAELEQWLDEHLLEADPAIQRVLYDSGPVDGPAIESLIEFLAHRVPTIRSAAQTRLVQSRATAAGAVVDALRSGGLSQQLCAWQILDQWNAPIGDIDPWQPESIDEETVAPLLAWLRQEPARQSDAPEEAALEPIDAQRMADAIGAVLAADVGSLTAALARAEGLGEQLAPDIRRLLDTPLGLGDRQRAGLRELLYRVLAGSRTRLEKATLLTSLASLDAQTHRTAASNLLSSTTSQDQLLVDELSKDADPLVREATIGRLQAMGALQEPSRMQRLLSDPHPSVRTAVLRELAQKPRAKSLETLVDYLGRETDEDLLVFGTKVLGELGSKGDAENALVQLSSNPSWRVRAAVLDAIKATLEGDSSSSFFGSIFSVEKKKSSALAEVVLRAADDSDPFVAERAAALLTQIISEETAAAIVTYLIANPSRLETLDRDVSEYEREELFKPLIDHAASLLDQGLAEETRIAATIISKLEPTRLRDSLPALLQAEDVATRITAVEALLESLKQLRDEELEQKLAGWDHSQPPALEPLVAWHEVPESFRTLAERTAVRTAEPDAANSSSDAASGAAETSELDLAASFFGGGASQSTPAEEEPPSVSADQVASSDASLDLAASLFGELPVVSETEPTRPTAKPQPIASVWLADWQQPSARRAAWVQSADEILRSKLAEMENPEADWLRLALLACGDSQFADNIEFLLDRASDADNLPGAPPLELVLPWLPGEQRIAQLTAAEVDWAELQSRDTKSVLESATEIDDARVAEWILSGLRAAPLRREQVPTATKLLLRALLGSRAEETATWLSLRDLEDSDGPFTRFTRDYEMPGHTAAAAWLSSIYPRQESPEMRAVLLAALSFCDHHLATQSAVGMIAAAEQYDTSTAVALAIALGDRSASSADRAAQWLGHALPEVRFAALDRLLQSGLEYGQQAVALGAAVLYDFEDNLPGLWHLRRALDVSELETLLDAADDSRRWQYQVLQVATGNREIALDSLTHDARMRQATMRLVAAVAKAERTDQDALRLYRQAAQQPEEPALIYSLLRNLPGEEIQQIRKEMRTRFSSEVLSNSGY